MVAGASVAGEIGLGVSTDMKGGWEGDLVLGGLGLYGGRC